LQLVQQRPVVSSTVDDLCKTTRDPEWVSQWVLGYLVVAAAAVVRHRVVLGSGWHLAVVVLAVAVPG
jgi:hypothetical protein